MSSENDCFSAVSDTIIARKGINFDTVFSTQTLHYIVTRYNKFKEQQYRARAYIREVGIRKSEVGGEVASQVGGRKSEVGDAVCTREAVPFG